MQQQQAFIKNTPCPFSQQSDTHSLHVRSKDGAAFTNKVKCAATIFLRKDAANLFMWLNAASFNRRKKDVVG